MNLGGAAEQIKVCYEELGMTLEQISIDQAVGGIPLDIVAVKSVLMNVSQKYRNDSKTDKKLEFTEEDKEAALETIRNTNKFAEDESLRFAAAKFIRNDSKGRLDINARQTGTVFQNVFILNQRIQKARKAIGKAIIDGTTGKVEQTQEGMAIQQ